MIGRLLAALPDAPRRLLHRQLAALVVYGVLQGLAFALLVPVLRALLDGDDDAAWRWLGALALVVAATAVASYVAAVAGYRVGIEVSRRLHHRLGDHVAGLPLGWFDDARVGQLGRFVSHGVVQVVAVPVHLLRPLVTALVTPLTVVVALVWFDWRLALATIATAPLLYAGVRVSASLIGRADEAVHDSGAEAAARIVEFARCQPVLRAYGQTRAAYAALDDALLDQRRARRRQLRLGIPGVALTAQVVQLAFTIVLIVGLDLALGGDVDPAELVAVLVLVVRFSEPLLLVADLSGALRLARNSLRRIDAVLAEPALPEPAEPAAPRDASVELDGVRFAYGARSVLDECSLRVEPRSVTALVGPSGAGKTTVIRLIARFWDVDGGAVRIGGVDVRELGSEVVMRQLAIVFQDVYLLEGTIADNVRLGRPDASDEEVRRACRLARLDGLAERLPDGWRTQVGEGGSRLSGGERQRVSIARAILKDAPIVLLDEPTAALDADNEAALREALHELARDRTVLVIAHRLQTIVGADRIAFLERGRVVESGTHDQLLRIDGRYAAFWRERERAAGWRLAGARDPARLH